MFFDPPSQGVSVIPTECLLRDGLQSLDRIFSTEEKIRLGEAIIKAGFQRIEVTSFVPEKYIPQFYDAEAVIRTLRPQTKATFLAFVPNARGMERAAQAKSDDAPIDQALIVVSASESHNQKNLRRSRQETMVEHRRAAEIAHKAGIGITGSISVAFGCPYEGDVALEAVAELVQHYIDIGAREIQFGDTTGSANPLQTQKLFHKILPLLGRVEPIAHFHDTRGSAIANSLAAIGAGVRIVDTSVGGTGGRPPDQRIQNSGPTGNTSTEDFVALLTEMGVDSGVDIDALLTLGRLFAEMDPTLSHSHIIHAGRVQHEVVTRTR